MCLNRVLSGFLDSLIFHALFTENVSRTASCSGHSRNLQLLVWGICHKLNDIGVLTLPKPVDVGFSKLDMIPRSSFLLLSTMIS